MGNDKEKIAESLPHKKEVKNMAAPIQATPVLKGKDLVDLVNDLKKPDKGKNRRQKALKLLLDVTRDKQ